MTTAADPIASCTVILRRGARSWEVTSGRVFRIGRHASNDLPIDDSRVSRFHAQIVWRGGEPLVEDGGSLNGTYLDGRRVYDARPLRSGQQIVVGGMRLDVELDEADAQGAAPAILDDDAQGGLEMFTERGAATVEVAFSRQPELHRMLLDLEDDARSGTVDLHLADGRRASMTFCLGRVMTAKDQRLEGLHALERLVRASAGTAVFRPTIAPQEGALDLSLRAYLKQGFWVTTRRHDRRLALSDRERDVVARFGRRAA